MTFWEFVDRHFWACWWLVVIVCLSVPSISITHQKDKDE